MVVTNKEINQKLDNSKYRNSDFANPIYKIVDYRFYDLHECVMAFRTEEDANYWLNKSLEVGTTAEIEFKEVNTVGLLNYITRQWKPKVHSFKNRGQAYYFLKENPEIVNSHELEF